ncbi:hypothetical protein ERO13_D11G252850v2 [Gossypium hirsutum]|uniref:Uncharacterized protein n=2 Tax=Gossypium TaxID=3633 RepID=A0A5J5PGE2_GOSBA|nr:hypothetical protein ES319_D11G275400v1 [Gossypium barbadense]KAG4122219.1 hypothetical protein ERO13_D11G252850v2 [Gossypium hirsutum]TYH45811.1 hypothetical protein ES332_D11G292000v1 [Gossypium tomentosum]
MDLSFKQIGMQMASGLGPRVVHSACFSALGYFAFETARLAILHQYLEHKEKGLSKINVAPALVTISSDNANFFHCLLNLFCCHVV